MGPAFCQWDCPGCNRSVTLDSICCPYLLKKILALVLALVMSLSLMATAGAADAGANGEQITPAYQTALDVLGKEGLKVFEGYSDGTFKPQQPITRAEVATILYRIATGDVNGTQSGIYTDMASTKFTDLEGANWARGYISCPWPGAHRHTGQPTRWRSPRPRCRPGPGSS